jgi:hypothetical protein
VKHKDCRKFIDPIPIAISTHHDQGCEAAKLACLLASPNIGNFEEFSSLLQAALKKSADVSRRPARSAIHLLGEIPNKLKYLGAQQSVAPQSDVWRF